MKNSALTLAGIIFALIALIHLSRLYFQFALVIGTFVVPIWVNVVGLFISAALSFWMFYALKSES